MNLEDSMLYQAHKEKKIQEQNMLCLPHKDWRTEHAVSVTQKSAIVPVA